jgi:methionyl-tRNA formyltransferase
VRAIFFGTPEFSVPCLDALTQIATVTLVVCQPDKPAGRGLSVAVPAVKQRALQLGLPVTQPAKVRTGELATLVREQNADVALVVAYGRILPEDVLSGPRLGCVNVHASILPKYRGAAPITWAIVRGEKETGVALMQMDVGMDTGAVLDVRTTPIGGDETAGELSPRLSALGAELVREKLPAFVRGDLVARPQDHDHATMAPILQKSHGKLDWTMDAACIHDHVRGMSPWPTAWTTLGGKRVIVHATRLEGDAPPDSAPGMVVLADKSRVIVACGTNKSADYVGRTSERPRCVELVHVQLEGRKVMRGGDWFLGRGIQHGSIVGT